MTTVEKVKSAGKPAIKFAAAGAGIVGSAFALKRLDAMLPTSLPAWVRKVGPGLATAVVAYLISTKVTDDRLKALLLGMGGGGAIDIARKFLPANISANIPALSGSPGYAAVNTGGAGWDYYLQNSLQGLGNAYALNGEGFSMQGLGDAFALNGEGFSMQGPGGAMQSMNSYALN